jgi:hypothetical protein
VSQWQELVTGKVRAGRWRHTAPWLLAAASAAIMLGALVLICALQAERSDRLANAKREYITTLSAAPGQLDPLVSTLQTERDNPAAALGHVDVKKPGHRSTRKTQRGGATAHAACQRSPCRVLRISGSAASISSAISPAPIRRPASP